MSKSPKFIAAALLAFALSVPAPAQQKADAKAGPRYHIGCSPTTDEIRGWDIDARPDGQGLPEGKGPVAHGEKLFMDNCSTCHRQFGEGNGRWIAKALEQRGIASLAHTPSLGLDRRKGMYDCATRHDYVVDDAVAEIGAWVTRAKSMSRFVFALGHSRGGNQVARDLAASESQPVADAVLLAPVRAKAEADLRSCPMC